MDIPLWLPKVINSLVLYVAITSSVLLIKIKFKKRENFMIFLLISIGMVITLSILYFIFSNGYYQQNRTFTN